LRQDVKYRIPNPYSRPPRQLEWCNGSDIIDIIDNIVRTATGQSGAIPHLRWRPLRAQDNPERVFLGLCRTEKIFLLRIFFLVLYYSIGGDGGPAGGDKDIDKDSNAKAFCE
jgi:hypothetical protein